jgi:cold shock CspA family protein
MTIGTVRWFDVRKGYGFLKPDDGGADVPVDVCAVGRRAKRFGAKTLAPYVRSIAAPTL